MKLKAIAALLLAASALTAQAQNYFDDKHFDTPVPHTVHYSNDTHRLVGISRTALSTNLTLTLKEYQIGACKLDIDSDCSLTDVATGKKYPIIVSTGIPKEPDYLNIEEAGEVELKIELAFPALPDNVKKVSTEFGIYDIEIGNVPVNLEGARQWFIDGCTNKDGSLKVYSVADNGTYTFITFIYEPERTSGAYLNPTTALVDPATGKVYQADYLLGLKSSKEHLTYSPTSFMVRFPSIVRDGVKTFNFVESPTSSWNISGIRLD